MSDIENPIVNNQELEEEPHVEIEKPTKAKRTPSAYNLFVKEHMSKLVDVPAKERMGKLGEMWKAEKEKATKKKEKKTKKEKKVKVAKK